MSFLKLTIEGEGCSMECAYATGDIGLCTCKCGGKHHGALLPEPEVVKCSPAAKERCMSGEEGGECHCACGGINHGLYSYVDMEKVTVNYYQPDTN